jgi:hypothetical protein
MIMEYIGLKQRESLRDKLELFVNESSWEGMKAFSKISYFI